MNVEHIPAEDVDVLPCGADWQSRHLESERRKAEIRDRIHKQTEQGQKTAKDYFRPAKPTPSIYDSDLKRVAVYARVSTSSEEQISSIENQTLLCLRSRTSRSDCFTGNCTGCTSCGIQQKEVRGAGYCSNPAGSIERIRGHPSELEWHQC